MTPRWEPLGAIEHTLIGAIAVSPAYARDATFLVATPAGLHVSRDRGNSWDRVAPGLLSPFIAEIALSPAYDGGGALLVSSPAGLFRSGDDGASWQLVPVVAGSALIAFIDAERFVAVAAESGAAWLGAIESESLRDLASIGGEVTELIVDPSGPIALTTTGALQLDPRELVWRAISPPAAQPQVSENVRWSVPHAAVIARIEAAAGAILATTVDGATFARMNHEGCWVPVDTPCRMEKTQVDPTLPLDANAQVVCVAGDGTIAAVRGGDGFVSVWRRTGAGAWRRVIAHPEPAHAVALVQLDHGRGLFAGIGDSVYRPSRTGAGLYTRESIDLERPLDVLHLAGVDERLVALTSSGLYESADEGFTWSPLPGPSALPSTAIALTHCGNTTTLVVAALGGELFRLDV